MDSSGEPKAGQNNLALWITVIVEALMIVAVGAYNVYEIRRGSELVQQQLKGLAEYSARQGEKVDRMTTALELYVGRKFTTDATAKPTTATTIAPATTEERVDKAIQFLEAWKNKKGKNQQEETANLTSPARTVPESQATTTTSSHSASTE